MRAILLGLAGLAAVATAPAALAQWTPGGPYTFVQGQSYTLTFNQAATDSFEALQVDVFFLNAIFEPIELLPASTPPELMLDAAIVNLGAQSRLRVSLLPEDAPTFSIPVAAGPVFGGRFKVKDAAPLGMTTVEVNFEAYFAHPTDASIASEVLGTANFDANIVAIPEPATWVMMLVGLGLVGACAVRARRGA